MPKLQTTVGLLFAASILACSASDPVESKTPQPVSSVNTPPVTSGQIAKPEPNVPWKIDKIERIDVPLNQVRTAIVLYPNPESKEALRECVRAVYAKLHDDIQSRKPDKKAWLKANVLVCWDDMDQRIGGSIANANFNARGNSLPEPTDIPDTKISIRWRFAEFEPARHDQELFAEFKAEALRQTEDYRVRKFRSVDGSFRVPSNEENEEFSQFERQIKKRIIASLANRESSSFDELRRRFVHVRLWRDEKSASRDDIDQWLREDDNSVFGYP